MGRAPGRNCTGRPSAPTASDWGWCPWNSPYDAQAVGADRVPDDQHDVAGPRRGRRQTGHGPEFSDACRPDDATARMPSTPRNAGKAHRSSPRVQATPRDRVADQPAEPGGQQQAACTVQRQPQQGRPDRQRRQQPGPRPQRDEPRSEPNSRRRPATRGSPSGPRGQPGRSRENPSPFDNIPPDSRRTS